MLYGLCIRSFHTTGHLVRSSGSPLAVLRKKTGYSFSNCKKALELYANNVQKAEEWLHGQAQTEGWAKVAKLQERSTLQGLVGLIHQANFAAMVEINCETDFVSRNQRFQELVSAAAHATLNHCVSLEQSDLSISKVYIPGQDINKLKSERHSDQLLADVVALNVGLLGENISLRRAICFRTGLDTAVSGYSHPPGPAVTDVTFGRFGALVAYRKLPDVPLQPGVSLDEIGKQFCQHIVGMNPSKIGSKNDTPAKDKDDETVLHLQEYLANPEHTVGEFLEQNGLEIVDYARFECGEKLE